jgi:hypothetical protein
MHQPPMVIDKTTFATQLERCRQVAERLDVDVVEEFVESSMLAWSHPALHQAVATAFWEALDYLIVPSRACLGRSNDDAFEAAWRLGRSGTQVVAADSEREIAFWSEKTSR